MQILQSKTLKTPAARVGCRGRQRDMAKFGKAPALGAGNCRFESCCPDEKICTAFHC